jgi:hypothetical protein
MSRHVPASSVDTKKRDSTVPQAEQVRRRLLSSVNIIYTDPVHELGIFQMT